MMAGLETTEVGPGPRRRAGRAGRGPRPLGRAEQHLEDAGSGSAERRSTRWQAGQTHRPWQDSGEMRLPTLLRRRGAPTEIGGVVRLDRRTKNLTKRLRPGEIAVIHHSDLDRVSAEALVEAGVSAVVNAVPSVSGRYPNLGPGHPDGGRDRADRRRRRRDLQRWRTRATGSPWTAAGCYGPARRACWPRARSTPPRCSRSSWSTPGRACPTRSRRSPTTRWPICGRRRSCCSRASACPRWPPRSRAGTC